MILEARRTSYVNFERNIFSPGVSMVFEVNRHGMILKEEEDILQKGILSVGLSDMPVEVSFWTETGCRFFWSGFPDAISSFSNIRHPKNERTLLDAYFEAQLKIDPTRGSYPQSWKLIKNVHVGGAVTPDSANTILWEVRHLQKYRRDKLRELGFEQQPETFAGQARELTAKAIAYFSIGNFVNVLLISYASTDQPQSAQFWYSLLAVTASLPYLVSKSR